MILSLLFFLFKRYGFSRLVILRFRHIQPVNNLPSARWAFINVVALFPSEHLVPAGSNKIITADIYPFAKYRKLIVVYA